jgi:hypothetical protein
VGQLAGEFFTLSRSHKAPNVKSGELVSLTACGGNNIGYNTTVIHRHNSLLLPQLLGASIHSWRPQHQPVPIQLPMNHFAPQMEHDSFLAEHSSDTHREHYHEPGNHLQASACNTTRSTQHNILHTW